MVDIEHLSYDELVELRDRVNTKIESIKAAEIETFKRETAERARRLGLPDPYSNLPKPKVRQSIPQTPPEDAKVWPNPADPTDRNKGWWEKKKGKRPRWAHD